MEIPPPEAAPEPGPGWALVVMPLALVAALAVFVTATAPELPPYEWVSRVGPEESLNLDSMVPVAEGFALLSGITSEGVRLWSTFDGEDWTSQIIGEAPTQLASAPTGVIAYGTSSGRLISRSDTGWAEGEEFTFPDVVRSRQGSGRPSLIATDEGLITMSISGEVWWSGDGKEFELVVSEPEWGRGAQVEVPFEAACRPPVVTSPDVPAMIPTDEGLVALVSSNPDEPFGIWPVCEPSVWRSRDGRTWTETGSTVEEGAYVYGMGWHQGRFVAVGGRGIGQPAVWVSGDGEQWTEIDTFSSMDGVDLYTVEAGDAGWVILGRDSAGEGTVGWTSSDGLCWLSVPWFVNGADAAVSTEHIIILDRTAYPDLWVGDVTGGRGSC